MNQNELGAGQDDLLDINFNDPSPPKRAPVTRTMNTMNQGEPEFLGSFSDYQPPSSDYQPPSSDYQPPSRIRDVSTATTISIAPPVPPRSRPPSSPMNSRDSHVNKMLQTVSPPTNEPPTAEIVDMCRLHEVIKEWPNMSQEERNFARQTFFKEYTSLEPEVKAKFPPAVRVIIDKATLLDNDTQDHLINYLSGDMNVFNGEHAVQALWLLVGQQRKELLSWICREPMSIRVWFFIVGFLMVFGGFLQIWIDFAYSRIWRAILLEFWFLFGFVVMILEANTDIIRAFCRDCLVKRYAPFLRSVWGRSAFYGFLGYIVLDQFKSSDVIIIIIGLLLIIFSIIRLVIYRFAKSKMEALHTRLECDTKAARDYYYEHLQQPDSDGWDIFDLSNAFGIVSDLDQAELIMWKLDTNHNDRVGCSEFVNWAVAQKFVRFKQG